MESIVPVSQAVCRNRVQACLFCFCLVENGTASCLLSFLEFVVKWARAQLSAIGPVTFIPDLRMDGLNVGISSFLGMEYLPSLSF